jgi:hypothetical protein
MALSTHSIHTDSKRYSLNNQHIVILFSKFHSTIHNKKKCATTHPHALNTQIWFKSGNISFVPLLGECCITTQHMSSCTVSATDVNNPNTRVIAHIAVNQLITQAIWPSPQCIGCNLPQVRSYRHCPQFHPLPSHAPGDRQCTHHHQGLSSRSQHSTVTTSKWKVCLNILNSHHPPVGASTNVNRLLHLDCFHRYNSHYKLLAIFHITIYSGVY